MSTPLADRSCVPCRRGAAPLLPEAVLALTLELPLWSLRDAGRRIERQYRLPDFASALAFVCRVAAIAEAADHHPDISFGWGYVRLSLHTHSIGGLHENDFIVAARCDLALGAP